MPELTSLLVGDHFRPPAKLILANLPAGAKLLLRLEDDNPYDEEAVRVLVETKSIPESRYSQLDQDLPSMGFTLEQVLSGGEVWLGYIPKSGGKPLLTAQRAEPGLVGNHEFREGMLSDSWSASLAFGQDGKARVILTVKYPD